MTEVEVYQEPQHFGGHRSALEQWANDAVLVNSVAQNLVMTSFVPKSYGGKAGEATAAILKGQELGLSPMTALASMNIIQGVPALTAIAMRGLVQARGHEIWVVESNKVRAIVRGRRHGSNNVEESEWTTDRARDLQLLGKDNWKKQPQAMLIARATSEVARLIAADVLLGMPYSVEEAADLSGEELAAIVAVPSGREEVEPAPAAVKRTARRQSLPSAQPEPVAEKAAPEPVSKPEPRQEPTEVAPEVQAEIEAEVAEERASAQDDGWPTREVPAGRGQTMDFGDDAWAPLPEDS